LLASARIRLLLVLVLWIATVLALVLWLGGRQEHHISIGAGPAESETFGLLTAIADVLNEMDNGLEISIFETGGTTENMELLETGQIDVATVQADSVIPEEALAVARLYPDAYHLVVNSAAGIGHFSDLRGHRVAIPPTSSAQNSSFWFLAEHYRLRAEDFTALPMSAKAANFAMLQEQVDAVFRVRAPGNPRIRELIGDHTMEIVPIHQSDALALKQPALSSGTIPRGSYRGYPPLPAEDLPTAVLDRLLVASAEMPVELIYKFTRELFEARSDLVSRYPLAGFMAALDEDADSSVPAHPGARRYFDREKPGLIQQNARMASAVLYAIVIFFTAAIALRSHWMKTRRVRMGDFNKRLMEIVEEARAADSYEALMGHKNHLINILGEVVSDLDQEKVSQEEFEHFSFTWQAVDALVRDQMLMLTLPDDVRRTSTGPREVTG
jgi:TRAP transporter TAXI family solute receptor